MEVGSGQWVKGCRDEQCAILQVLRRVFPQLWHHMFAKDGRTQHAIAALQLETRLCPVWTSWVARTILDSKGTSASPCSSWANAHRCCARERERRRAHAKRCLLFHHVSGCTYYWYLIWWLAPGFFEREYLDGSEIHETWKRLPCQKDGECSEFGDWRTTGRGFESYLGRACLKKGLQGKDVHKMHFAPKVTTVHDYYMIHVDTCGPTQRTTNVYYFNIISATDFWLKPFWVKPPLQGQA